MDEGVHAHHGELGEADFLTNDPQWGNYGKSFKVILHHPWIISNHQTHNMILTNSEGILLGFSLSHWLPLAYRSIEIRRAQTETNTTLSTSCPLRFRCVLNKTQHTPRLGGEID